MVYGYDCPHRTSQLQNESTVHRVDGDLHVLDSSCKSFCTQVHHGKDFWQNLTRCPLLTSPNSLWASMTSFSQDTDLRCLLVAPSSPDLPPHDSTGHAYQTTTGTATKKMLGGDKENQILVSHKQRPWAGLEPATFLEVIFHAHVSSVRSKTQDVIATTPPQLFLRKQRIFAVYKQ